MPKMTLLRSIEVEPTVEEIAQAFADMGSDGQAKFFNEIHRIVTAEYSYGMVGFDTQMSFAQDDLTPEGREVMRSIGAFADPQS